MSAPSKHHLPSTFFTTNFNFFLRPMRPMRVSTTSASASISTSPSTYCFFLFFMLMLTHRTHFDGPLLNTAYECCLIEKSRSRIGTHTNKRVYITYTHTSVCTCIHATFGKAAEVCVKTISSRENTLRLL